MRRPASVDVGADDVAPVVDAGGDRLQLGAGSVERGETALAHHEGADRGFRILVDLTVDADARVCRGPG
jgi:hypothetical protein